VEDLASANTEDKNLYVRIVEDLASANTESKNPNVRIAILLSAKSVPKLFLKEQ
jgi:hypothetical protein